MQLFIAVLKLHDLPAEHSGYRGTDLKSKVTSSLTVTFAVTVIDYSVTAGT